jgi:chromosome segregation ATPase
VDHTLLREETVSKQKDEQTSVADAERTLHELQAKRERVVVRAAELAVERKDAAYAAHVEKNADARRRLNAVNAESAQHASELKSVEDALATAQERLGAARQHAARERDRAQARELRAQLAALTEASVSLDEALQALAEEGHALLEVVSKMHTLGTSYPSHEQVRVFGTHAVLTALMETPWKRGFQTLAPNERRNIRQLVQTWVATIERDVRARLGEAEQTNDEAA